MTIEQIVASVEARRRRLTPPERPMLVGITGGVAAGKSHLATALARELADRPGRPTVSTLGTDAFLYPNATIDARGAGMRKGFPETYDRERLRAALAALRTGHGVTVPVYSHVRYDIDPGAHRGVEARSVVIVDGLHLGLLARDLLDLLVHLVADEADLERWYRDRFRSLLAEGRDEPGSFFASMAGLGEDGAMEVATQAWELVNLPNLRLHVEPARVLADLVVVKGADHEVVAVTAMTAS